MTTRVLHAAIAAAFLAASAAAHAQAPNPGGNAGVTERAGTSASARQSCEKLSDASLKEKCLRDVGSSAAGAGTGSTGAGGSSSGVVGSGGTTGTVGPSSPPPRSGAAK